MCISSSSPKANAMMQLVLEITIYCKRSRGIMNEVVYKLPKTFSVL